MKTVPLFGSGLAGKSLVVTAERRVNCYFENRPDKDRSPIVCYGTPGMQLAFAVGNVAEPIRGMQGDANYLYSVIGRAFFKNDSLGAQIFTSASVLNSVAGNVSLAVNPTQVLIVDGVNGYIFAAGALTPIATASFPNGAKTATFCSGYFICEVPGSQQFQVSAFYDGTTWPALGFASASQYSDLLLACDSLIGNLILFCGTHTEFWQIVGGVPQPFQPILSATTEWGLAAIFSRAHVDNSLIFLGQSPQGGVSVCQIQGYQTTPISDPDLDSIMGTFATVADAVAMSYRADKHAFYQITFPSVGRSFLFDCLTRLWSEVQTGVPVNTYAQRHVGNFSALVGTKLFISDYQNNNLYTPNPTQYTDNGQIIVRQIVTRHEQKDFNVYSVDELFFDMETGVGLSVGQGSDPTVLISCSKDDGRTWLTPRPFKLGKQGAYKTRVVTRRWGQARRFTWQLYMTDPVKFVVTSGAESQRERQQ